MLDRLARDAAAMFVLDGAGRILRENDPDRSPGPRFALLTCRDGALAYVRRDVPDKIAAALVEATRRLPPWIPADPPPPQVALVDLLAPVTSVEPSLVHALPQGVWAERADVVRSGAAAGHALLDHLAREGMPPHLVEAGFGSLADFWAPWCALLAEGEIAALAFAARLGDDAAEIGVYTFPAWRGRGLAGAATAAWAAHPDLGGRELFYSCLVSNHASRRVAAKLGLEHIAMGLRIT